MISSVHTLPERPCPRCGKPQPIHGASCCKKCVRKTQHPIRQCETCASAGIWQSEICPDCNGFGSQQMEKEEEHHG